MKPKSYIMERSEVADSGCWLWKKHIVPSGYGAAWDDGKRVRAHRLSYEVFIGPIPDGAIIMHKCDVRHCVNPSHLRVGTQAQNIKDRDQKGRGVFPAGERHGNSKLKKGDVIAIRDSKESQTDVARRYGVSQSLVSRIKNEHLWRAL